MPLFSATARSATPLMFPASRIQIEITLLDINGRAICDSFAFLGNSVVVQLIDRHKLYFGPSPELPLVVVDIFNLVSSNISIFMDGSSYKIYRGFESAYPGNGVVFLQYGLTYPYDDDFWAISRALSTSATQRQKCIFDVDHDADGSTRVAAEMVRSPLNLGTYAETGLLEDHVRDRPDLDNGGVFRGNTEIDLEYAGLLLITLLSFLLLLKYLRRV